MSEAVASARASAGKRHSAHSLWASWISGFDRSINACTTFLRMACASTGAILEFGSSTWRKRSARALMYTNMWRSSCSVERFARPFTLILFCTLAL